MQTDRTGMYWHRMLALGLLLIAIDTILVIVTTMRGWWFENLYLVLFALALIPIAMIGVFRLAEMLFRVRIQGQEIQILFAGRVIIARGALCEALCVRYRKLWPDILFCGGKRIHLYLLDAHSLRQLIWDIERAQAQCESVRVYDSASGQYRVVEHSQLSPGMVSVRMPGVLGPVWVSPDQLRDAAAAGGAGDDAPQPVAARSLLVM